MGIQIIQGPHDILTLGAMDSLKIHSGKGQDAASWWEAGGAAGCWAAYQPKGAASLAASYTDLTGNGNNAGVGVAPTWDAVNGWIFNGLTQYLTTTFVPQSDQSQTIIVQFSNRTDNDCLCGTSTGTSYFWIYPKLGGGQAYYGNGGLTVPAGGIDAGNLCVAGNQPYKNGVAHGGTIASEPTVLIAPVYIGGRIGFPVSSPCAAYIQAFALYDNSLTSDQVAAVAAAMAAL